MQTLDQTIRERIAEKRAQAEENARWKEEKQKRIEEEERRVVELFRQWIKDHLFIDLDGQEITAFYSTDHFMVDLHFGSGAVRFQRPIILKDDEIEVLPIERLDVWHATHTTRNETFYVDYSNFVDAVIYAKYGSSEPNDFLE